MTVVAQQIKCLVELKTRASNGAAMENAKEYTMENLQKCAYRDLQKITKSMCLPSNVKKWYLIQMIYAKKFGSAQEVENLVRTVRQERQNLALDRKSTKTNKKQSQNIHSEVSITSQNKSPSITPTPKRTRHIMIRYSPDQYSPPKSRICRNISFGNGNIDASDRVLRSFRSSRNTKNVLENSLFGTTKSSGSEESIKNIGDVSVSTTDRSQQVNMPALSRKRSLGRRSVNEIVPVLRMRKERANISQPVKRQRKISGIYPLDEEAKSASVSVRRADGTLSKLKTYIQKQFTRNHSEGREHFTHENDSIIRFTPITTTHLKTATITNLKSATISNSITTTNISGIRISYFESPVNCEDNEDTSNMSKENQVSYLEGPVSCEDNEDTSNMCKENTPQVARNTVYYHSMYRAEQVRCQVTKDWSRSTSNECRLPRIHDVFSKFKTVYERDVTRPIYSHLDTEAETTRNPYPFVQSYQTTPLENLYNLKNQHLSFLMNRPLFQIATTTNTYCVYSTPTISTPKAQPPANMCNYYNVASSQDNTHYGVVQPRVDSSSYRIENPRVHNFYQDIRSEEALQDNSHYRTEDPQIDNTLYGVRVDNTHYRLEEPHVENSHCQMEDPRIHDIYRNIRSDEALSDETTIDAPRSSSVDAPPTQETQDLGDNVTIPDMVEDALEIISQDGDYMERMGMEIRMRCVLCDWAGPKIILEYHIRREHETNILQCCRLSGECVLLYSLGALVGRGAWVNLVLENSQELFILSAKYQDPDRFTATLTTLSSEDITITGSITTFNKVTGEPFTWKGTVEQLPPNMAYDDDPDGLKLDLSKIDLLPNSANLKLLNRELVTKSPNKVVVGQPELDSIQISLIVKLYN